MATESDTREDRSGADPAAARQRGIGPALLSRLIARISVGRLTVVTPSGERVSHRGSRPGPEATLVIHRWRAIVRLATGGNVGFAAAYIDGDWSSPDTTQVVALAAANVEALEASLGSLLPIRLWNQVLHAVKGNTRSGSRRNITHHYDLGNAFYSRWLDPSMTYSSALYTGPGQSLEAAQAAKIERVIALLAIPPGAEVLEIGCGWGALGAAIGRAGARVRGITLSREQLAWARDRVARDGLADRVHFALEDYRDTRGSYDAVVSVEMIEAVGEAYWPTYFQAIADRLKPGGRAVIQAITIDEPRFESYRRDTDFIQRYIFPGGMLPTPSIIAEEARRAGLAVDSVDRFGRSYAATLAEWRRRFLAAWPEIRPLGFDERFRRMWEYYLCYCEGGFLSGTIDVGHYVLRR